MELVGGAGGGQAAVCVDCKEGIEHQDMGDIRSEERGCKLGVHYLQS